MRCPVRRNFSRVVTYGLLLAFAPASLAQDMVGPSGDRSGEVPVMPPEAAEVLAPSEAAAVDDTAFRYQREWQTLTDAGQHNEAAELAGTWYNDAVIQYGEQSEAAAAALRYQGDSYLAVNDAVRAAKAYNDAIKVVEREMGVFDSSLVIPLTSLGMVYLEQGDYDASVSALMRAKDITHRNQGIFNREQAPIVDVLTETFLGLGEINQATREQRFLHGTAEKTYGKDHPDVVPSLLKWAEWNARIKRLPTARRTFREAIAVLEENFGPDDLRIVDVLNRIARSFYNHSDVRTSEGTNALRRAVDIYRAQEFVDHADLLRQQGRLGDAYMVAQSRSRGVDTYRGAIAEAREAGLADEVIDGLFGVPRVITLKAEPLGLSRLQLAELGTGPRRVVFEFDLDAAGRPRNLQTIEDEVGIISILKVLKMRLGDWVFRPRFVDGEPVATFGLRIQYDVFPQRNLAVPTTAKQAPAAP